MYLKYLIPLILLLFNFGDKASSTGPKKNFIHKPILIPHYNHLYFRKQTSEKQLGEYERYEELSRKIFIERVNGKSCAVVGSSSNLIGSNYGSFIDSHDIVFRMNDVSLEKKHSQDSGFRTTIRFINAKEINPTNNNFNFLSENGNQFYMISAEHPELTKSFSKYYNQIVLWRSSEINTLLEGLGYETQSFSAELKTLYYAMSLCKEVDVFGLGVDKFDEKGYLLNELARQKQINLYKGNADIPTLTTKAQIKRIKPILHLSHIINKDKDYSNKTQTQAKENFFNTVNGKACAVVGASSNLINSNYGEFIDSHDVVFRVNDHRVIQPYAKDIGKKTSIRFINSPHDWLVPTEGNDLNIKPGSDDQFFVIAPNHSLLKPEFSPYHKNLIVFNSTALPKYIHTYSNKIKDLSAGLQSIFLAMCLCEKVDVYGFGIDGNGVRGYYDYQKYPKRIFDNKAHEPDEQDKLIEELAKQKQINLYMGNAEKAK